METRKVLERAQKEDVKFISLQLTDLLGVPREVIVPAQKLQDILSEGVWFDGSSIEGFARIQESDLFMKPDPATFAVVPWLTENGKTARLICDICRANGEPFEGDPRFILKKVMNQAAEMGFQYDVGPEPEFYLFDRSSPSKNQPVDSGSYFELFSYKGSKIIKEIIAALASFGIDVETSHHEVGNGQYEIGFNYGNCLEVADKVLTLKYTVKEIAQMHNLTATFMPKPIPNRAGSGMHIHQSLFDKSSKKNAFYDENDKYRLSKTAYAFIAGQFKHIKALCAVLSPTINSYKRLVSGYEAPVYITWATMNRSALIRVPKWLQQKHQAARIELRSPDPTCNPYLALAVMLKAGLDGIKNNLTAPEPVEENVYEFDDESRLKKNIDVLPTSLWQALNELKSSQLVRDVLGDYLFEKYMNIKTAELDEFKSQVTAWEIDKYLDTY